MPRNDVSQWSTLKSGPLATQKKAEFRAFATKKREPVVHSGEWTTGYPGKGRIPDKCPEKLQPLPLPFQQALQIPQLSG